MEHPNPTARFAPSKILHFANKYLSLGMAKIEISVRGEDIEHVEFWRKKIAKALPELSPATDLQKSGNRYTVTFSEETELERKSRK